MPVKCVRHLLQTAWLLQMQKNIQNKVSIQDSAMK